ncbi:MAG TPA: hypothetical protein VIS94_04095 [Desulfomonilia bacterium]
MNNVERRAYARKNMDDIALVHINTPKGSIEKSARIDNISLGGICLKNIYTVENEDKGPYLEGELAAVYFRSIPISVFGTVSRQEAGGKLIVKIKQSTDDSLWEKINVS